jgi:UrcA family protein
MGLVGTHFSIAVPSHGVRDCRLAFNPLELPAIWRSPARPQTFLRRLQPSLRTLRGPRRHRSATVRSPFRRTIDGYPDMRRRTRDKATVDVSDLNLSNAEDVRVTQRRLAAAAQRLCRRLNDDRKTGSWDAYVECSKETLTAALTQIKSASRVTSNHPGGQQTVSANSRGTSPE